MGIGFGAVEWGQGKSLFTGFAADARTNDFQFLVLVDGEWLFALGAVVDVHFLGGLVGEFDADEARAGEVCKGLAVLKNYGPESLGRRGGFNYQNVARATLHPVSGDFRNRKGIASRWQGFDFRHEVGPNVPLEVGF
jgi:hypothetical protein